MGIDFDITHDDDTVHIKTAQGKAYRVSFSEYKSAVFAFAKQIISFYQQNTPLKFEDELEQNGFNNFFNVLHALFSYDPDEWKFVDKARKSFAGRLGLMTPPPSEQKSVIVLFSEKGNTYTVRFANLNDAIESNIEDIINDMKQTDDDKIIRLVCLIGGALGLPSFAFRDRLCRLNHDNLNTLILCQGLNAPIAKAVKATMPKGYIDRLLSENN
ncbi:MAG: hypothetical protein IJY39_12880 [Clostridia bacterium]|nr:hypothetical protein [Clostridia bacterium]